MQDLKANDTSFYYIDKANHKGNPGRLEKKPSIRNILKSAEKLLSSSCLMSFHSEKLFIFSRHATIYSQVCLCEHTLEKVTFLTQHHNTVHIFYLQNDLEKCIQGEQNRII